MARKTSTNEKRTPMQKNTLKPAVKRAAPGKATTPAPAKTAAKKRSPEESSTGSKKETVLALLRRKNGVSVEELAASTGWQEHSVRGFLSGTVKKKLGLKLTSEKPEGGERRYFVRGRL